MDLELAGDRKRGRQMLSIRTIMMALASFVLALIVAPVAQARAPDGTFQTMMVINSNNSANAITTAVMPAPALTTNDLNDISVLAFVTNKEDLALCAGTSVTGPNPHHVITFADPAPPDYPLVL